MEGGPRLAYGAGTFQLSGHVWRKVRVFRIKDRMWKQEGDETTERAVRKQYDKYITAGI